MAKIILTDDEMWDLQRFVELLVVPKSKLKDYKGDDIDSYKEVFKMLDSEDQKMLKYLYSKTDFMRKDVMDNPTYNKFQGFIPSINKAVRLYDEEFKDNYVIQGYENFAKKLFKLGSLYESVETELKNVKIFNHLDDFLDYIDNIGYGKNKINGCTQEFLDSNGLTLKKFDKMNKNNEQCFNCWNCVNCEFCYECENCKECCKCWDCTSCEFCNNCNNCIECIECEYCQKCISCLELSDEEDVDGVDAEWEDLDENFINEETPVQQPVIEQPVNYIFRDYKDYYKNRKNNQNGCTKEFLKRCYNNNLDRWKKENTTNKNCFNCISCVNCVDCINCESCIKCVGCDECWNCDKCTNCTKYENENGVNNKYKFRKDYHTELDNIKDLKFDGKQLNESFVYEATTRNNAERKEELIKYLKGTNYHDYIKTLNDMLEDPKTKTLLIDGFGGELGDTKLKFETVSLPVSGLVPSQSEIDVEKSLKYPLTNPENIKNSYSNKGKNVVIKYPIVTFRGTFIIDGHHRWSQVYAMNPDATMTCFNYDSGSISPQSMLKTTQGTIAAVMADTTNDNNGDKLPNNTVEGQNLYDKKWGEEEIKEYVKETASDDVIEVLAECRKGKKYWSKFNNMDDVANFIANNMISLKANNDPIFGAPNRGEMPQTDKGGTDENDDTSSSPETEGSALNKLANDEFVEDAVK